MLLMQLILNRVIGTACAALVLAVKATFIFFYTFNSRRPFWLARSIVVIDWYLSSFLLISVTVAASKNRQLAPQLAEPLTQAFFYACFAGGLYVIVSSLMLVSVCQARLNYNETEYILVTRHKSLVYQTITFEAYLMVGAAIFAQIEKWGYLDAVFWAHCTVLTIGLGDFSPKSHLGRSLLFPYAVGGVMLLGIMITSIQSFFSPRQERKLRMLRRKKEQILLQRLRSE